MVPTKTTTILPRSSCATGEVYEIYLACELILSPSTIQRLLHADVGSRNPAVLLNKGRDIHLVSFIQVGGIALGIVDL